MRNGWSMLFSLAIVVVFASCKNDPVEVNAVTKRDSLPFITTRDVDMTFTDSAKIKIHLKAPVVEEYQGMEEKSVFSEGVDVQFYDDNGAVNSSLRADYAERRKNERITIAKKDVVVVNVKGEQLNTEKLTWDEKNRLFYTDAFVKITTADQVIMGNGLESDDTFTNYEITDITGTIMLNE